MLILVNFFLSAVVMLATEECNYYLLKLYNTFNRVYLLRVSVLS
jgi:hypothetical protein